mmetsp:Transcript_7668/g.15703  ORF Transcript_7668/g.15703 Transcript_7668/m.15703 type:complete len:202 (+) Transcript_7668:883-1488(+)
MLTERRFVDLFVKSIPLTGKLPQTRAVQWIQTRVQSQGLVHLPISSNGFHQIKTAEPDGAVFQKLGTNFFLVLGEVLGTEGVVIGGSTDFEGAMGHFGGFFLGLFHVDSVRIPSCQRTFPHATQIGFAQITLHEFLGTQALTPFPFWFPPCRRSNSLRRLGGRRGQASGEVAPLSRGEAGDGGEECGDEEGGGCDLHGDLE